MCTNRGALCNITGICDGARCVECLTDTNCFSSLEVCTGNECVTQCQEQADCPYFHDCQNGACVEVGCSNDRECIAFTRNVLAYCDAEKECQVPCATDIECDSATSFDFTAQKRLKHRLRPDKQHAGLEPGSAGDNRCTLPAPTPGQQGGMSPCIRGSLA